MAAQQQPPRPFTTCLTARRWCGCRSTSSGSRRRRNICCCRSCAPAAATACSPHVRCPPSRRWQRMVRRRAGKAAWVEGVAGVAEAAAGGAGVAAGAGAPPPPPRTGATWRLRLRLRQRLLRTALRVRTTAPARAAAAAGGRRQARPAGWAGRRRCCTLGCRAARWMARTCSCACLRRQTWGRSPPVTPSWPTWQPMAGARVASGARARMIRRRTTPATTSARATVQPAPLPGAHTSAATRRCPRRRSSSTSCQRGCAAQRPACRGVCTPAQVRAQQLHRSGCTPISTSCSSRISTSRTRCCCSRTQSPL